MLRCLVCALLLLTFQHAAARTLYISSDLGHAITIVARADRTGSNVDANKYSVFKIKDDSFDQYFYDRVVGIAAKADPGATVERLHLPADVVTGEADDRDLVKAVLDAGKSFAPGDRVVALVPQKMPIKFTVLGGTAGSGRAAGLGAYTDSERDWTTDDRNLDANGTLAMFTNFRIVLIDPATRSIVTNDDVQQGMAHTGKNAAAGEKNGGPWDAIPAAEKLTILEGLVTDQLDHILPGRLSAAH
jgi:hypothetical protein